MKFAMDHAMRLLPAAATERYPNAGPSAEVEAAASSHRFDEFTPDCETWVAFYGAEGGEQA